MTHLIMTIGVPGSGKTTFIDNHYGWTDDYFLVNEYFRISSDQYIEDYALSVGKSYNEVFFDQIKPATYRMNEDLKKVVSKSGRILWDQTNLTVKTRELKLVNIPQSYKKTALYFPVNEITVWDINEKRKQAGRSLPKQVLKSMIEQIEKPSFDEGFDEIITVERKK